MFSLDRPNAAGLLAAADQVHVGHHGRDGKYKKPARHGAATLHMNPFFYPAICFPAPGGCGGFPDAGTFTLRLT